MKLLKISFTVVLLMMFISPLVSQNFISYNLKKDTVLTGDKVYVDIKLIKSTLLNAIDLSALNSIKNLIDTSLTDVSIESYGNWKVNDNMVDMNSIQWQKNEEGKDVAYTTLELVFWDNGIFKLPQINIQKGMPLQTPNVVVYAPQDIVQTAADSTDVIMPIKSIIREYRNIYDYLPYILGLLGLAIIFGLFYFLKKKKVETEEEVVEIIRPAHELALEALDELSKKQLWQQGKIKEYQSELTYIIRAYLGKRYDINALENTTDEILRLLKNTDFNDKHKSEVSNILQMADMIKFAKATPSDDIHQTFWDQAKALVIDTKLEEENKPITE